VLRFSDRVIEGLLVACLKYGCLCTKSLLTAAFQAIHTCTSNEEKNMVTVSHMFSLITQFAFLYYNNNSDSCVWTKLEMF